MKKIAAFILILALMAMPPEPAAGYLPQTWAKEDIDEAISLGFVPEELREDYQRNITRVEFARMAAAFAAMQYNVDWDDFESVYGQAHPRYTDRHLTPLSDTEDIWVYLAYRLGIVSGRGNGTFDPDAPITRQEAARLLMNTYRVYSDTTALPGQSNENFSGVFGDTETIADWALGDVAALWEWNVIRGTGDNLFKPQDCCSREQGIVMFLRLYQQAPLSRYAGKPLCPISYDQFVSEIRNQYDNQIKDSFGYYLYNEIDTAGCTVFYIGVGGTPHGMSNRLWIIYKNGGRKEIYGRMPKGPDAPPLFNYSIDNMVLSADEKTLTFTCAYYYFNNVPVRCAVELVTGKLTITESAA